MDVKIWTSVFLVLLSILSAGIAGADMNGPQQAGGGAGIAPLSSGADAKNTQVFWYPGTLGYLNDYDTTSSLVRQVTEADLSVVAGGSGWFVTPFALPAKINNRPTSVRFLYFLWRGNPTSSIGNIYAISGQSMITSVSLNHPGTGSSEIVTVDLQGWYPIANGLGVSWTIPNNDMTSAANCAIYGYGAKIRYAS